MLQPDVCIAGAGIIGLSLALELHTRGASVVVLDQGEPLAEASTAAAGMLAAHDPENPRELLPLSRLSLELYPHYLHRIFDLCGSLVSFHTSTTLQAIDKHRGATQFPVLGGDTLALLAPYLAAAGREFVLLGEHSLDPRELAVGLLAAVRSTGIDLRPHTTARVVRTQTQHVEVLTDQETVTSSTFVDCTGAWSHSLSAPPELWVLPRKGQMLAVELPESLPLHLVLRTPDIYIVPRTSDPDRTKAVIGATVEDAGYDKTVNPNDIARLRALATELLPALAEATELETWAGLRPATSDLLPLIGQVGERRFVATGHYRNGILLAPATAHSLAETLSGRSPTVDLGAFSPFRERKV